MSRSQRIRKQLRGGFGLTDAVGMIVLISMLFSLSAVVLNRAFVAQRSAMDYFQRSQSLQKLHDRLHADAHRAVDCEVGDEVRIELGDGQEILYSLRNDRLVRATTVREVTEGEELWRLPAKGNLQSRLDRTGRIPLLYVELQFEPAEKAITPVQWIYRLPSDGDAVPAATGNPEASLPAEEFR